MTEAEPNSAQGTDMARAIWLGWHCVLGPRPVRSQQQDFIIDFVGPTVAALGISIDLFHFFRYYRHLASLDWSEQDKARVLAHVNGSDAISYITFRVRVVDDSLADDVAARVQGRSTGVPHALFVPEPRESAVVRKGLETYGGNDVHPLQHQFFDCISRVSLALLGKARLGHLTICGATCGTEAVALQWAHMILNQLGVIERPASTLGQDLFYLAQISE